MKKTIIFQIDGGLGKSIMGTAVLSAIKKQYPNDYIVVVTSYPDVFIGNPNVNKVLGHGQTNGVYKKYIMNKRIAIITGSSGLVGLESLRFFAKHFDLIIVLLCLFFY